MSSRRELHACVGLVTDASPDAVLAFARDHGVAAWAIDATVELCFHDPIDVMIGWAAMRAAWRVELMAVASSAVALELLDGDASPAWRAALQELGGPPPDARGILAVRQFSEVRYWPVPDALAEQRLPTGEGVVACSVGHADVSAIVLVPGLAIQFGLPVALVVLGATP